MAYNEIDTNDMEIWKKACLKTIYRWEELYDDYKYYETISNTPTFKLCFSFYLLR